MNEFNIITTYYNNKDLLLNFVDGFNYQKEKYKFLKLYIIDDGSKQYPAESFLKQQNDIYLYKVIEDLGFNSHGCRNLGMTLSDKKWNLLIDSDINLKKLKIDTFYLLPLIEGDVIDLSVNCLFIDKETFFSCKGYDEEYVNYHIGDRALLDYLSDNFYFECWLKGNKSNLIHSRSGRKIVVSDSVDITTYDDTNKLLYVPQKVHDNIKQIRSTVIERYKKKDFSQKKILNFEWTRVW